MGYLCPVYSANMGNTGLPGQPNDGKYHYYGYFCGDPTQAPKDLVYDHKLTVLGCCDATNYRPDCYAAAPHLAGGAAPPPPDTGTNCCSNSGGGPLIPTAQSYPPPYMVPPLDWNCGYPGAGRRVQELAAIDLRLNLTTPGLGSRYVRLFRILFKPPAAAAQLWHVGVEINGFAPENPASVPVVTSTNETLHPYHRVYFDGDEYLVSVVP